MLDFLTIKVPHMIILTDWLSILFNDYFHSFNLINAVRHCINSLLFIFYNLCNSNIFSKDSDDDSPEEFTNVYKLSREEYFWNMYNSSSFSECWEILKEG